MKCVNNHCPFNSDAPTDGCILLPDDVDDHFGSECPQKIVVPRADLSKEIKALKDGLKDSNIVWANMLRGTIAKPQQLEYLEGRAKDLEFLLECSWVQLDGRVDRCGCSTICRDCNDNNKLIKSIDKARK